MFGNNPLRVKLPVLHLQTVSTAQFDVPCHLSHNLYQNTKTLNSGYIVVCVDADFLRHEIICDFIIMIVNRDVGVKARIC